MTTYRKLSVPVEGGELAAGVWGDGQGTVVLAAHGVTSSHRAWQLVGERLAATHPDVTLVAPDLRGRGDSRSLPGPHGMAVHAADCAAVLDHLGAGSVVVAGHSMGGFVALVLADLYPERVSRLVLVDGGPPLPPPPGDTPEQKMAAVIGPAADRLAMRFPDRRAYRDFYRRHPAFTEWTPSIESYVDYDLTDTGNGWRSKATAESMHGDSVDLYTGAALPDAWRRLRHDAVFLRAEGGMLGAPPPLYADTTFIEARMPVRTLAGTNHYTVLLGETGAAAVAEVLARP
jgi:lipase